MDLPPESNITSMVTTELFSRALFRRYLHSRGWWLVILAIPVLFALWFVVTVFTMGIARFVPLNVSGYLTTYLAEGIILISYAAALLSLPCILTANMSRSTPSGSQLFSIISWSFRCSMSQLHASICTFGIGISGFRDSLSTRSDRGQE